MAFTVSDDHVRQEQVWHQVYNSRGSSADPYIIRRTLTEKKVHAADKRARFIGVDAYEAAGGLVTRDLFAQDEGGWLQDPALVDRYLETGHAAVIQIVSTGEALMMLRSSPTMSSCPIGAKYTWLQSRSSITSPPTGIGRRRSSSMRY
jgi:hypothetical protein